MSLVGWFDGGGVKQGGIKYTFLSAGALENGVKGQPFKDQNYWARELSTRIARAVVGQGH